MMVTEIVVGVAVAITAIVSLVLCICGKDKNARSPNHLDGRTEDNNNDKREEAVAVRERSDNARRNFDPDKTESVRPKTLTINRKLPEIPHSATTTAPAAELITADLYATVDETTAHNKTPALTSSALNSPAPSISSLQQSTHHHQNVGASAAEPSNRNRPSSMSDRPAQIFEQRHNYAKIKSQTSDDKDTDTDTYCDPAQVYADTAGNGATRSFEARATLYEPPPPPVPEKYFELGAEAGTSTQSSSLSSSAASAIAGNPSIVDIPFMTSPVPSNQNLNFVEDSDTYTRSDNVLQEIRYTSISVREPLANIRAQMIRPTPPGIVPASSAVVVVESHYSIVPEEVDQTYAEIESAQHSATSSMTYRRINADGERMMMMTTSSSSVPIAGANYPPAPPTVESLRTVAQAHSRHASSSSCISESSHHNSPATDRSFDLNDGTCDGRSSTSVSPDFSAIYSVVDKSKKIRSTVHVMEDHSGNSSNVSSAIEDMYAKVTKKRVVVHDQTGARPKRPNTIDVNHVIVGPHENHHLPPVSVVVRRQSSDTRDFGYEKIRDVAEEEQHTPADVFDGVEIRKKNASKEAANYEVVESENQQRVTSYPNYETIKESSSSLHYIGYPGSFEYDQESENGYEKVKNVIGAFSRSDPNYESVRMGAARDVDGNEAAASCWGDAFYEKINGREDDDQSDPNYENVKTVSESSNETSEFGYESVPPKRKLFEVEDGYERIRDRRVCHLMSRKPALEPGYESIKDRVNIASSLEGGDDDALYAVPSEPFNRNRTTDVDSEQSVTNEENGLNSDL